MHCSSIEVGVPYVDNKPLSTTSRGSFIKKIAMVSLPTQDLNMVSLLVASGEPAVLVATAPAHLTKLPDSTEPLQGGARGSDVHRHTKPHA